MAEEITVIIKKVGKEPYLLKMKASLDEFRRIIDGPLEVATVGYDGLKLYCDEDGKIKGKPANFIFGEYPDTVTIVGDVVFFRTSGECEVSVSDKDVRHITNMIGWQRIDKDFFSAPKH